MNRNAKVYPTHRATRSPTRPRSIPARLRQLNFELKFGLIALDLFRAFPLPDRSIPGALNHRCVSEIVVGNRSRSGNTETLKLRLAVVGPTHSLHCSSFLGFNPKRSMETIGKLDGLGLT